MSSVGQALLLVSFPVAAAVLGAVVAVLVRITPRTASGVQHLAAGVVLAALAGEVLPDLRDEGHRTVAVLGFGVGVVFLLAVQSLGARVQTSRRGPALPVGLLVTVGVDLLLDGVLVGVGSSLGQRQALIITTALTLEIVFLALSVAAELRTRGLSRVVSAAVPSGLGLLTAAGAVGGAAAFGSAGAATQTATLAFAAAALLYLVAEELLTEAHEAPDTPFLTALFFLGFIVIYTLGG